MNTSLSRRRDGFTLIEILIVVAVIGILVGVAFPAFMKSRTQARKQVCIENLAQIETAKQQWGLTGGHKDGDVPTDAELFGPTGYVKLKPDCPAGGAYELNAIGTNATCNIEGHSL